MKSIYRVCYVIIILLPLTSIFAHAQELILTAGPRGSDAVEIGQSLAGLLGDKRLIVKMTTTSGDTQSIDSLVKGSAALAVVDGFSAYEAFLGIGPFSRTKGRGFSAVAVVGMSVEHFLLLAPTADKGDITDFTGKIIYTGPKDDPASSAARTALSSSGIESFSEVGQEWDLSTAAELMVDGTIDGAILSGPVPLAPVTHLGTVMGNHIVFLEVPDSILMNMRAQWPIWFPYTVPGKTYPDRVKPYKTVARPIMLIAAQGLDTKTVKGLLTNLFADANAQTLSKLSFPVTESMSFTYCPIKFHPGAADYFREKGY